MQLENKYRLDEFMQNHAGWLNFLKIRASYGEVGNDQIGGGRRFPYLTLINFGGGLSLIHI